MPKRFPRSAHSLGCEFCWGNCNALKKPSLSAETTLRAFVNEIVSGLIYMLEAFIVRENQTGICQFQLPLGDMLLQRHLRSRVATPGSLPTEKSTEPGENSNRNAHYGKNGLFIWKGSDRNGRK